MPGSVHCYLNLFVRFITGGLFVFSGLIKLNDPVGTSIKMEEYFTVFAEDFWGAFQGLIPWSMEIGMAVIILEIVLGVAVLLQHYMKLTSGFLLGLILFFTALTFYSAYFEKVTDCGCFGDAIKLTPWQSFYKDLVLTSLVGYLLGYRKQYFQVIPPVRGHLIVGGVFLLSLFMGIYAVRHLPFIDFRPYKIGDNVAKNRIPEEQPIIEYTFKKQDETVQSTKFLSQQDGYEYVSSRVLNPEKVIPKIVDYSVFDSDGQDKTDYTLQGTHLLIVMYDVEKASTKKMDALHSLIQGLDGRINVFLLTASSPPLVNAFRHEHQLAVPYYFADATVLKTIIRSNPGIALWKNGDVLGKWHYNDTPDAEEVLGLL